MVVSEILEKLFSSGKAGVDTFRLQPCPLCRALQQRLSCIRFEPASQVGGVSLLNRALEKTFDFGAQLARANWLTHIVGESGIDRLLAVALHRARRKGKYRSYSELCMAPEFSDDLETVHPRHVQIENDEIRSKLPRRA